MAITIADIDKRLQQLSTDKLHVVHDFVSFLIERDSLAMPELEQEDKAARRATLLLTEAALQRDWNDPQEDMAWDYL